MLGKLAVYREHGLFYVICSALMVLWIAIPGVAEAASLAFRLPGEPDPECDSTTPCHDIWVADEDGGNQTLLINGARNGPDLGIDGVAISADGGLLAATGYDRANLRDYLYIFDSNGSLREIYSDLFAGSTGGQYISFPRFSPDGKTVIYSGDALGGPGIYSFSRVTGTSTLLVNWAAGQIRPTFSADGSKIAFASPTDPEGKYHSNFKSGDPLPYHIYIASSNGANPTRVTPSSMEFATNARFSPDGQRLLFRGNKTKGSGQGLGLFTIGTDGSDLARVTSANDRSPDWSPDGSSIAFERNLDGLYIAAPNGSGQSEIVSEVSAAYPSFRQPRSADNFEQLLEEFAPEIRYEAQESFYADSAATITDNAGNLLKREDSAVLAARGVAPHPELSLSFLGFPQYLNDESSFSSDFSDEDNDDYAADAQELHNKKAYADRVYGRVAQAPDGRAWLQYWLFFYYNDQEVAGFGVHEGDWEMVQIRLDENGAPDLGAYAQHNAGERCPWEEMERSWIEDGGLGRYAPVVYSARASHASYFHAGTYRDGFDPAPDDYATGDGIAAAPDLTEISVADPWIAWPGSWGASGASPVGPLHNSGGAKWEDPSSWADELPECEASEAAMTLRGSNEKVPPPSVSAKRVGNNVHIKYFFAKWPESPSKSPHRLILSVDSRGRNPEGIPYAPLSYTHRINGRRGEYVQPIGLARSVCGAS